ncbi:N-acetylmuramoyl-L-alanine amidase family protein [Clostridium sp. C2-6-12]|uniref:N-acetylmuramoyl-L-alanine amidase family protein n=1 Tax=Clostridium sp. C2-6-12 TaxID=2698832 RepID=UPI00136B9C4A|nr:N-acetylmuramoyl-L-alanine amidase family protein [Clostridium sp. C2-6-12]
MTSFLFLVSLICLIIGIVKPQKIIFWKHEKYRTRKNVLKYFGSATIILFILVGIFNQNNSSKPTVAVADNKTQTVTHAEVQEKNDSTEPTKEVKKSGWVQEKENWYYYDNGTPKTGWLQDNNKYYYLNSLGAMQKGWVKEGGKDYYLDNSGVMQIGWKQSNGNWYYLNTDGAMVTNTTVDGCYLSSNGAMQEKSSGNLSTNTNSNVKSNTNINSGSKQYIDSNGNGLIKGSVNHIYHIPGSTYYSRTKNVVRWFKTVEEAQAAGYRAPEK